MVKRPPYTSFDDYVILSLKALIKQYEIQLQDADITEKTIYSLIVTDLKEMLADFIHH